MPLWGRLCRLICLLGRLSHSCTPPATGSLLSFLSPWLLYVLSVLLAALGQKWGLAPYHHLILDLPLPVSGGCSPCVTFPPMIQSPSPCSQHSFMQNLEPLLGPGKLHRPPPAASPTPLLVLLFSLGFLLASQSVLAGTFCDLCTPTRDSCHLKHQPLAHRHSPWWGPLEPGADHGYGERRFGYKNRVSWH